MRHDELKFIIINNKYWTEPVLPMHYMTNAEHFVAGNNIHHAHRTMKSNEKKRKRKTPVNFMSVRTARMHLWRPQKFAQIAIAASSTWEPLRIIGEGDNEKEEEDRAIKVQKAKAHSTPVLALGIVTPTIFHAHVHLQLAQRSLLGQQYLTCGNKIIN